MKKEWRVSGLEMLLVQSSLLCDSEVREKKVGIAKEIGRGRKRLED
jgi:hypothetical protein